MGVRSLTGTIRGRILLAFLVMALITGGLGAYAALTIEQSGVLVARTFDRSLMSINYARAASADFEAMQTALARRIAAPPDERQALDARIEALGRSLAEDLTIAAERSHSARAAAAAAKVQQAVAAWNEERRKLLAGLDPDRMWKALDRHATEVERQIDLLVNYTAGDGFLYRQTARTAIRDATRLNLAAALMAVLLSALVAWLLARRIIGPVAAASAVAGRIARGELDTAVPRGGADELGALLAAMTVMRDNIRATVEGEVAQRRSAQARLADALESSREGVLMLDAKGRIVMANSQAADFFGSSRARLQGTAFAECSPAAIGHAADGTASRHDVDRPLAGEVRLSDGRWLRVSRSATQDGGSIVVCSDISVLKAQEATLKSTNLRLDAALENMSQGLCLYDAENRLQVVNRRFCEIFRLPPERVRPGIALEDVMALSVEAGNHGGKQAAELAAEHAEVVAEGAASPYVQEFSDGRVVAIAHQRTADGGWVATYEDITERRRAEAQVLFMARHDALTGLPNRVLFVERVEQALAQAGRGSGFAVLCLDLDDFKQVNDTLGHPVGDELLRRVGERLRACVREVDTVARLGGDEFAIVLHGVKRADDAATLARRVIKVVGAPYDLDGHHITIGVSIGISLAPGDGTSSNKLLKNADVALYGAKEVGRGTWQFFQAEMDMRLQARRALELDLREALAKSELELFYQPIYDLRLDRIKGFEALLRWRHPVRGMVSPVEFIPLAEEIGLIVQIGEWVLQRACAEAGGWPGHLKVAVNVSPIQFRDGRLVETVATALAASGLPAERLELEITESVLLTNTSATLATLHELHKLGLSISLDDFGTGYSSLSYLRSFPFDKMKIDRSFIRDLGSENGSDAIVSATIGLASSLGMRLTAEGVETEEQLARLRLEGCDEVQGYYFSPPVPAREVPKLLQRWTARGEQAA